MEKIREALNLLTTETNAILSTHSIEVSGYPFGSVTPYTLNEKFNPVIYISHLAQHTKNIIKNNKVSLTILEHATDPQKSARITFLGEAHKCTNESNRFYYLKCFPNAKSFEEIHGFDFYEINCERIRFIKGFGKIFWIEKDEWPTENFTDYKGESEVIEHMNVEHLNVLEEIIGEKGVKLLSIDKFGMVIHTSSGPIRKEFPKILEDMHDCHMLFKNYKKNFLN